MSEVVDRLATVVALAEKSPGLGRTAVMKLCYFLQTLRKVPLGYRFRLYSYGPFDASLLSDLSLAETLGGVHSDIVFYPNGYGHQILPSGSSDSVKAWGADFLRQYEGDINWVVEKFAGFGSADLELLSTIIYVDRESARAREAYSEEQLAHAVHEVKPRFAESYIQGKVADLRGLGLLKSLQAASVGRRS